LFINDKYYIFSIMIVFLTLGIGIFIGITLNDNDVFSEGQKDLLAELEMEFEHLRDKNKMYKQEISNLNTHLYSIEKFLENNIEKIIKDKLIGQKIVLVGFDETVTEGITNILEIAGAEIYSEIDLKCGLLSDIDLQTSFLDRFLSKPDYVILAGNNSGNNQNDGKNHNICYDFIDNFMLSDINIIVIENEMDISKKYKKEKITTIRNLDSAFGQISLILSIEKGLKGYFGSFDISEKLLPN